MAAIRLPSRPIVLTVLGALSLLAGLTAGPQSLAAAPAPAVCRGTPADGVDVLHGPVLHVPDGSTVCVATGFDPALWVPVRLSDAPANGTRATLMAAAFGKDVDCLLRDGKATCRIEGRSVGAIAGEPAIIHAALSWRESANDAFGQ